MSDQDYGKKLVEEAELEAFLHEYRHVTGNDLQILARSERPDFICGTRDGAVVGVELTKVVEDPDTRSWRTIINKQDYADEMGTAIQLQELIYRKDAALSAPRWHLPDRTILVIQLMDSSLELVAPFLDEQVLEELCSTGFIEIWLADYTLIEPYGTVQLFGVKPKEWQGLHLHSRNGTKPYG